MESQDSGLQVVEQIRNKLGDETVRIILRTGHPGTAPELEVVRTYDISDYKTKSELTAQKLSAALLTSLKTHELLTKLAEKQHSLERLNQLLQRQATEILNNKLLVEAVINGSAHQAIVATDEQQTIRYINSKAADFFASPASTIIGQNLSEFMGNQGLEPGKLEQAVETLTREQEASINLPGGKITLSAVVDRNMVNRGLILLAPIETRQEQVAPHPHEQNSASQFTKKITIPGFIGNHPAMQQVFSLIQDLANFTAPVLIQGESGTGKELVAASIHNLSQRRDKIYLPINCGALPEHLLESELFGHEKGAFTGAIRTKKGLFEQANGGTLFLDDIGEITALMQVKLLRVVQEGTLQRLGGEGIIKVDVRIISATNKVLLQETEAGRFREDLYYRLCVVPINLPPLRQRRSDIPLLAHHFLKQIKEQEGQNSHIELSQQVITFLGNYSWPGNARELQNVIHFSTVLCHGQNIGLEHLPPTLSPDITPSPAETGSTTGGIDEQAILTALEKTANNRQEAAKLLGVSRATFYRYLNKFETEKKG